MALLDILRRLRTRVDAPETSGGAVAPQREIFGPSLPIASDHYGVTELKQAHYWTPIEEVLKAPGNVYCLDMEETTLDVTVDWIRAVRYLEPFETRRVPVVCLIGPPRALSSEELREINSELKSAGGYFYKRPDYNATFEDTMAALQAELVKQYGPPGRRDAWRRTQREPDLVTR